VKANAKQIAEGKAAPKVLKKQSDAVVTKGTKAKMASAGMAMYQYQGSAIQGSRSGQTKEISPTIASSAGRRTVWLVTLFGWNDLASEGLG
jgi:hypothetical protein